MTRIIRNMPAVYHDIVAPTAYASNPLIETLPPIFSVDDIIVDIKNSPPVDFIAERQLPARQRMHCVAALYDVVITLPQLFDVESDLSMLLRRGLAQRNPLSREWRRALYSIRDEMAVPLGEYQVRDRCAPAMLVIAVSGGGKTTTVLSLLEMYPQTIIHERYKGIDFPHVQIVWLAVNASFDASLKGLILSIFGAIDEAVGTTLRQQYERSKVTIDTMIGALAQVVSTYSVGVLFVDEIQSFLLRGGVEAQLALSFFLKLSNVCRVPVIFSGTYAAIKLFGATVRNARRVCTGGYVDLELPDRYDNKIWDQLVVTPLWRYQWLNSPAPLDEPLRKLLFELTQGIISLLVLLLAASQMYAIRGGHATVDAKLLRHVYKTRFVLLHPALDALKSKKRNRLQRFEDLLPPKEQLAELLRPSVAEEQEALIEKLLAAHRETDAESGAAKTDSVKPGIAEKEKPDLSARIGANTHLQGVAKSAGLLRGEAEA